MKLLKGHKTQLGFLAYAVLKAIVDWDPGDAITDSTPWVLAATATITAWTGYAIRDAISKPR